MTRRIAALLACAVLAACAGYGGSRALPAAAPESIAQAQTSGTLLVSISIPAIVAHAHYVSPSTQSMVLTLTGGKHPLRKTVELTSGSKSCHMAVDVRLCSASFALAPARYRATVSTYDKKSGRGNLLSQGTALPFVIRAAKSTPLKLALSGIPHALAIAPDAPGIHTPAEGPYVLYGAAPLAFDVEPMDADGNEIVGAGSPTYTVAIATSSPSGWSATAPSKASPNTFHVTPNGVNGSTSVVGVTAHFLHAACDQKGEVCTHFFDVTNDIQHAFVLSASGVTEYTTPLTSTSTPMPLAINDSTGPTQMAMDSAGNVYIANCIATCGLGSPDSVTIYGPPSTAGTTGTTPTTPTATITSGVDYPHAIAVTSGGDLIVGNDNGSVAIYTPPFSNASVPASTITAGIGSVQALALDASGNLFVANCGTSCAESPPDAVYEYSAPYTGAPIATMTADVADPWAFAFAPNGGLFVANVAGTGAHTGPFSIAGYAPPFNGAPALLSTPGEPYGMTFDSAGDLFVANCGTGCGVTTATDDSLLEFAPPYDGPPLVIDTSTGASGALLRPQAVAIDGFGNLMSANTYNANASIYAPPYTAGAPSAVTVMTAGPTQFILTP